MYEYGNIEDAVAGDVVERLTPFSANRKTEKSLVVGELCIVEARKNNYITINKNPDMILSNFKLVKTKPGSEAKVGDSVIRLKDGTRNCPNGTVFTVLEIGHSSLYYASSLSAEMYECKVLCKAEPISTEKRNIAFYKRSGEPWTNDELKQIAAYTGIKYWGNINPNKKFVYDLGLEDTNESYANWADQNRDNFKNCEQVVYEDVFKTPYILETPRIAVVTVSVGGHPIGSRIVPTDVSNHGWKLADGSKPFTYCHTIGYNCEWEDTLTTCTNTVTDDISPATECSQPTPRVAIVTKDVDGHPVGSRIIPIYMDTNYYWILANNSSSKHYHHSLGSNCEWEDELVGSTWEQIDHSGARNAGDITTISKISENVHIHYYASNSSIYNHFFKMFKKYNPLEAIKPEPATPCSQHDDIVDAISCITQTIPEEEAMNENITIAMTADEYAKYQKSNKPTKPKSQLETAPKWFTIWYGVNGNVDCQTTESPKKAKKALQHPSKLGFTFRSYLITESATTDIPVVNVTV